MSGDLFRYKNQDVGEMYVNDVDDLRKQMRYVYEHQDEALEKGEKRVNMLRNGRLKIPVLN